MQDALDVAFCTPPFLFLSKAQPAKMYKHDKVSQDQELVVLLTYIFSYSI